jgi:hypothetical protein
MKIDRLRTFGSAYLLAVLSGRIFVVDWNHPQRLDTLIQTIFPWEHEL